MTLQEILVDIHALGEELLAFERRYRIRFNTDLLWARIMPPSAVDIFLLEKKLKVAASLAPPTKSTPGAWAASSISINLF